MDEGEAIVSKKGMFLLIAMVVAAGVGALFLTEYKTEVPAPAPNDAQIAFAEAAIPAEFDLAQIYDRSCRACHGVDGAGAPLTGHQDDWLYRLETRGADGLLTAAKAGVGNMPAMGLCSDCSDDELQRLIQFMSTKGTS